MSDSLGLVIWFPAMAATQNAWPGNSGRSSRAEPAPGRDAALRTGCGASSGYRCRARAVDRGGTCALHPGESHQYLGQPRPPGM